MMIRWFTGAVAAVIAAAVIAGALTWYVARPSSYDECVVAEMRGQMALVKDAVERLCAVRFQKLDELPGSYLTSGKLDFSLLPDFDKDPGVVMMGSKNFRNPPMIVRVKTNDTDYDIRRVRMKHSHKFKLDCDIADDEWFEGPEFDIVNGSANVAMPGEYDEKSKLSRPPFCYQYVKVWGTPKRR